MSHTCRLCDAPVNRLGNHLDEAGRSRHKVALAEEQLRKARASVDWWERRLASARAELSELLPEGS